jgi:hypothetical protein
MVYKGNLLKMRVEKINPVNYYLPLGNTEVFLNDLVGKPIELKYQGEINCIKCGRKTNKSFAQGYCFPCFQNAPETEDCVLRPELCKAHIGVARDMQFARERCLIDHFVYLSFTSNVKVGITRHTQIPVRWIDQGASLAIKIARTPNRYLAGLIEVNLKQKYADKTQWSAMLKDIEPSYDLLAEKENAINALDDSLKEYIWPDNEIMYITYPIINYPDKIKSVDLEKNTHIKGTLVGIKGQYLMFDSGQVINIRKYGGYLVELIII